MYRNRKRDIVSIIIMLIIIILILYRLLNIMGDLEDLEVVLKKNVQKKVFGSGSCSALVKVLPGMKDLYVSQDTWSGYNTMLRILKKYIFKFHWIMKEGIKYIFFNLQFYLKCLIN